MPIEKYVSIKLIIEGLYRDLKLQEEINVTDTVEWVAEALSAIGVKYQYRNRITDGCDADIIKVEGHIGCLPADFHTLVQVSYNGLPLYPARSNFGNISTQTNIPSIGTANNGMTPIDTTHFPDLANTNSSSIYETYTINNNFITTSFREGNIVMSYLAIPLDEEGLPLVPDSFYYNKATKAYITLMLDTIEWRAGRTRDAVYKESLRRWNKYILAAKASGLMPSIDMTENILKNWISLLPKVSEHFTFFKNLGTDEGLLHR